MKIDFPHKQMNGILKYFSRRDKLYFNNSKLFTYSSSGIWEDKYTHNAFDFESNGYWVSAESDNIFLSFCFASGFADLTGYEIRTTSGEKKPCKWSFSASNDNVTWFGNKQEEHSMNYEETYYVDWSNGPAKCFKFVFINNSENSGAQTDIKYIELFGRYFDNNLHLNTYKCKRSTNILTQFNY